MCGRVIFVHNTAKGLQNDFFRFYVMYTGAIRGMRGGNKMCVLRNRDGVRFDFVWIFVVHPFAFCSNCGIG